MIPKYSVSSVLAEAIKILQSVNDSPRLDAEILLSYVLDKPRIFLHTWPNHLISAEQIVRFQILCQRRAYGEPIAYLIGKKAFWDVELSVNPHTLIPRPETELLVEYILTHFSNTATLQGADLGTGSGAIALALARNCPAWHISATDISSDALRVAQQNAHDYQLINITFYQGDWCSALPHTSFHFIVSNPPYIAPDDPHLSALHYEPLQALVGGANGLAAYETLIAQAKTYLATGGKLILEHGYQQAASVHALLACHGYTNIVKHLDLNSLPRFITATKE